MANLILQNESHVSQTFQDVTEVEIPTAEGGTQTFSAGGGGTAGVTRFRTYDSSSVTFSTESPSTESDLDRLVQVATTTLSAGKTVVDVSCIGFLEGYVNVNGGTPMTFSPEGWNESNYYTITQTGNQDGTTTVSVTYTPRNNGVYRSLFGSGLTEGYVSSYLYVAITTTE